MMYKVLFLYSIIFIIHVNINTDYYCFAISKFAFCFYKFIKMYTVFYYFLKLFISKYNYDVKLILMNIVVHEKNDEIYYFIK